MVHSDIEVVYVGILSSFVIFPHHVLCFVSFSNWPYFLCNCCF